MKTTRLISPEDAEALRARRKHAGVLHRDRDIRKKSEVQKKGTMI